MTILINPTSLNWFDNDMLDTSDLIYMITLTSYVWPDLTRNEWADNTKNKWLDMT